MELTKAVITADIVNSSSLNEQQLDHLLFDVKTELKARKAKSDFYRGDSFHALCDADQALLLSLRLRTIAKKGPWGEKENDIDIRIALGVGPVEEPVRNMASAKGEAFVISGRELEVISKSTKRLSIRCSDKKLDAGMEGLSVLIDWIMQKMSSKQAEAVGELLNGLTQMEIARKLRKSQSTINKLAQAANWGELEQAIQIYRKLVSLTTE